ncbi:MAG: hypothetical protein ACREXM_19730 [Gammaproteobacteria bacterium]
MRVIHEILSHWIGGAWAFASQIEFPIAMVVFGESEVGARREE